MKVLVDTCVWSKVLRADKPDLELAHVLRKLIVENRAVIIGPILQEILSGVKNKKNFEDLREKLAVFDDFPITEEIYIKAAEYFNLCKIQGINGGHIDFLICAVLLHYNCVLFTIDSDFKLFKKCLPIKLLEI